MLAQHARKFCTIDILVFGDAMLKNMHGDLMGRPMGRVKKKTFAVLIKIPPNSNTICGHMLGVSHFDLEGIGPVVIENERKYAWGGLPMNVWLGLPMRFSDITFGVLNRFL